MSQNRSSAVMQQRTEPHDSLDYFPTPPWATRALMEHVIKPWADWSNSTAWEPACGEGYMARVLAEYFGTVHASDIHPYGHGDVDDFLLFGSGAEYEPIDWIITNPPFRLAQEFIETAINKARHGIAVIVRSAFTEGIERYQRLFRVLPPHTIAQFTERVAMVRGRVDEEASSATAYCWIVWRCDELRVLPSRELRTKYVWIPPCRKQLERATDYPTVTPSSGSGVVGSESAASSNASFDFGEDAPHAE